MIVKKQGTCLGYSEKELEIIRKVTTGYSTRKKNQVRFDPSELK